MTVTLFLLAFSGVLLVAMLYAACQKRYKRFGLLSLTALAVEQLAEVLLAAGRHQYLLMGLYLFSCVSLPAAVYYWYRKAGKSNSRLGQ